MDDSDLAPPPVSNRKGEVQGFLKGRRIVTWQKPNRYLRSAASLLLQAVDADRADHDFIADHIAWGAADAERVGELHALIDRLFHLVAVHVLLDARHVEADFLGDRERARLVGRAAAAQQLLVKFDVLLAG